MDDKSILILGATASSEALIKQLLKLNFQITLIDADATALSHFEDRYDIICLLGQPSHPNILEQALHTNPKYLVAMTHQDETNLLAIQALSNKPLRSICCIHDENYLKSVQFPNIDIGHIVLLNQSVINEFKRLSHFPEFHHINDVSPQHIAISIQLNNHPHIGNTLNDIHSLLPPNTILAGLYRNDTWVDYRKNIKLTAEDTILVITDAAQIASFAQSNICNQMTILGISDLAHSLCENLSSEFEITVIDPKLERCENLTLQQPNVTVIHHDPQDHQFLHPYVSQQQATLTLSVDDENNLIYAFGALDAGATSTFNLVNHIRDGHIFASSPIHHIINKPQIISDHIYRDILSQKSVNYFYTKLNFMQIASIHVREDHPFLNCSIQDLNIDQSARVGCIIRDGTLIFTSKKHTIKEGDSVIIYAPHQQDEINPLEILMTDQL
ncbi:NAD-binding protein [Gammaproteobacteria bacterium]|nr:NAD-binding protein [Gammaproteobacteria bacterium]